MYPIARNATNVIYPARILSDAGLPIESLQHDTPGLSVDFMRPGDTDWTSITLVGGVIGSYSQGGFAERPGAGGWYELGLPDDAILASKVTDIRIRTSDNDYRFGAVAATGQLGGGPVNHPVTITNQGVPVDGASVWVTRDVAGTEIVAGYFTTDASGTPTEPVLLDPGDYFLWVQKAEVNFPNPTPITAGQ